MPFAGKVEPQAFRRRHNVAMAYASEAAFPLLRAVSFLRRTGHRTAPQSWRRGLILGHSHIGDVLYRTCSLQALRESLPECAWTFATTTGGAAVLRGNPNIEEVLPVVAGEDSWELADDGFDRLRSRQFDAVLCTNTLRHYPDLALATWLGIPNRVAFVGKGFSGLIDHPVQLPFPSAYPAYFRTMVAAVCDRAPDWNLIPRLYPDTVDEDNAMRCWADLGVGNGRPVVACSLLTRQKDGNWPPAVMLSILAAARARMQFDVVLSGSEADAAFIHELASSLPFEVSVVAGRLSVREFASFLGRCSALLTTDSGPRHIGNAMGIPVVFGRNLSHSRVEAGRYCPTEIDVAPPVEYLGNEEASRVAHSQPEERMADALLSAIQTRPGSLR